MKHKSSTIYFRLVKLLIFAGLLAAAGFAAMDAAVTGILDYYFSHSDYAETQTQKSIDELQDYIEKNNVNTTDGEALTRWVKRQSIVSMQIYKNNVLTYDSNYPDEAEIQESNSEREFYDWETYYILQFADGSAEVVLYGLYNFRIYGYAMLAELLLSFLLFLIVVMAGIRKTMRYILVLNKEIGILEGGNLDYSITIQGKDELAMVAASLESMRKSFKAQVEKEAYLTRANKKLITEMSHDLRTPLTSILIYTEILKNKRYDSPRQMQEYVEKIDRKAHQMKQLAENIFEYSLISSETRVVLDEPVPMKELLYDVLSEAASHLEQNGFQTEFDMSWGQGKIQVNAGYLTRIMDNILSNIVKYGDARECVKIEVRSDGDWGTVRFSNKKSCCGNKNDSNQIGLKNIEGMMKKMGGVSNVEDTQEYFSLSLRFRYAEESADGLCDSRRRQKEADGR